MLMRKKNQGYAIVIVMVLLVIGTATLIMFNRESLFFSKITAFFTRSRKIQAQAQDGIELAKGDLRLITKNSRDPNSVGVDKFAVLASGSAINMGLKYDSGTTRTLTPRIARTDGDFDLKVYYFPENPCSTTSPCGTDQQYNEVLPKRFIIVSQATNRGNGEIFTAESRVQLNLLNYAELTYAILGVKCLKLGGGCSKFDPLKYPAGAFYDVSPATYSGQAYFDMPPDMLRFVLDTAAPEWQDQQHVFQDIATFKETTPTGQKTPFITSDWAVWQQQMDGHWATIPGSIKPMLTFAKGYEEGKQLVDPADDDTNPASDTYFNKMKALANTSGLGYNLSNPLSCPLLPNNLGKKQVDICLKFEKNKIKRYDCKKYNDDFMGRIDKNMHPASAYTGDPGMDWAWGLTHSDTGIFKPGTGQEDTFPDRYTGEHAEVYTGAAAAGKTELGNTSGVIFCDNGTSCTCNVHIKGIIDGQVTVVAQNVVIEGDLRYQHQNESSTDSLGVVAKNQIIIPAGIPQAANSFIPESPVTMTDYEPPYNNTVSGTPPAFARPINLANAYLNITNFIPYDTTSGAYVDRNAKNPVYRPFANWYLNDTNNNMYGTPTALDLDGYFYAGDSVKVDSVFNPKDYTTAATTLEQDNTARTDSSMTYIVCENPPTCSTYRYRDPSIKSDVDPKAFYRADGSLSYSLFTGGEKVQPLFWVDGLEPVNWYIDQGYMNTKNAQYNDLNYNPGEEVALPLSRVINVYGSLNSKFHFIYDKIQKSSGATLRMGFHRKIVEKNKMAAFSPPPGFPSTAIIKLDELYTKNLSGKSKLLP